jgi:FAD/FMN-containing dehydrogenase/Fe-S oxidoreductase
MDRLEQQRDRTLDDLRGLVAGDVRGDDVFRQLYASDASIYEIRPLAVVRPRSTSDVAACVRYAAEKRIPLHARGAGTGVAGESLGPGLVVDFSRHMRRVVRTDAETVRVQPGVVHERLGAELRRAGRVFGPDPAGSAVTTIGGMIGVDAAGSRWLRYGSTVGRVRSLQIVLADGEVMEVGREPLVPPEDFKPNPRKRELVGRLAALLGEHGPLVEKHRPRSPLGRCGYHLHDVLRDGRVDVPRLLCGSEGTLALVTEATLATDPLPRHRGVALLLFDRLEAAARAALEVLSSGPSACDLMDRRHLSLARESEVRLDLLVPVEAEAALLVEQESDDAVSLRQWLQRLVARLHAEKRLAFAAHLALDPDEVALFWQLGGKARPALYQGRGVVRPVPVIEDLAVPPETLPDFFHRALGVLKRHQVTASLYCRAGQGQVLVQPLLNLNEADDVERMRRAADDLYGEVFALGGAIVGEHACGLSRTPALGEHLGPLYDVLRRVKQIFDPDGLLNPGKIVGDGGEGSARRVRPPLPPAIPEPLPGAGDEAEPAGELRNLLELQLDWDPAKVCGPVADCNRCGDCRTQAPDLRMCPMLRFAPSEEASPRAKANLLRGILTGQVPLEGLTGEEAKQLADLCVHCHACRLECPARVDIPRLVREAKAAYVAANGLTLHQWVVTHLDAIGALGGLTSPAANWALSNRPIRWLIEKTLGVAQGRRLPRLASRSFLRRAARRRLTRPSRQTGRKVAYFVDVYANHFDPHLGEALVSVMERNGVAVYVPPDQRQAGMASIAIGSLDHARQLARANVAVLAEAVRQGCHVVASEPSAALCLAREYPQLIDDDDARLLAANASEACTYLWKLHTTGRLQLDFKPVHARLAYHLPCHLRALGVGTPGLNLLRLIPGLQVEHVEEGCSGMAGTFGLLRVNYRNSLRAGWRLISRLRDPEFEAGATECSTCKMQMEQGTTKPTIHPIKLLALAYGLLPEGSGLWRAPAARRPAK